MNPYEAPTTMTASEQHTVREAAPRSPGNPRAVTAWAWGVVFVTLIVNAYLLFISRADKDGMGGLAIMIFIGPIANMSIMLVSLLLYIVVHIHAKGAAMYYYGQACIGAPLLAIIVDTVAILMMGGIHGC